MGTKGTKQLSDFSTIELIMYQSELMGMSDRIKELLDAVYGNPVFRFEGNEEKRKQVEKQANRLKEYWTILSTKLQEIDKIIGKKLFKDANIYLTYSNVLEDIRKMDKILFTEYQKSMAEKEKALKGNVKPELKNINKIDYDKK